MRKLRWAASGLVASLLAAMAAAPATAGVGDPQVRTDHPWYPGELACSTFDRLFRTQAELFERVVGVRPGTDEQKALASWLWRCTHYWHGEEGAQDLWGEGFDRGDDPRTREYWTGLFAHGFGLCGTTHAQWAAEMEALLGHNRGRVVGVDGHNSFEVLLTGGPYGAGKWALLDHDIATVVFDPAGRSLLSIPEVGTDLGRLTDPGFAPGRQHGWPVCGLHPGDGASYRRYGTAEYLAGYSGPPPMAHLRRGETLRRYLEPGLEDGRTFVFWGRNMNAGDIPGPERARTWVNQPERLYGARDGSGFRPGQARYANAVYEYTPDFATSDYREGVVAEDEAAVVFAFATPYIIAATPPDDSPWGIYRPGCRNGLVLRGRTPCAVAVSTDAGTTWQDCGALAEGLDLTDRVKGQQRYWIRFGAGAAALAGSGLTMTTVCQANASILPHLTDGGSRVGFLASGRAVASAGPRRPHAEAHVVAGGFDTPAVTLEVATPRGEPALALDAAAHVRSGNPPRPEVNYQIEYSTDSGATWTPLVRDWTIPRRGQEPPDFWSQSLCWGSAELDREATGPVRVRFRNDGGKAYARAEAHLVYRVASADATKVTFHWTDAAGAHRASHTFPAAEKDASWDVPTGQDVRTHWVEFEPVSVR
ncbi:MAG TPA: hypothetical protein VF590_23435 [Isosphaeraceae bacterium]|jgi:hypothetical protein